MEFTGKVLQKRQLAGQIYELRISLAEPSGIDFIAGQFITFKIDGKLRAYSISSAPKTSQSELELCVDVSPGGLGSKFVEKMQAGDTVVFEGPFGFFHFKKLVAPTDVLLVCTGVGVAPFKAIVEDALQTNFPGQITLLFGVRDEQALFYDQNFAQLAAGHANFKFIPALSQPSASWQGYSGRVTKYLAEHFDEYKDSQVFICGSPEMVKDTRALLIDKGLPLAKIKLEIFN